MSLAVKNPLPFIKNGDEKIHYGYFDIFIFADKKNDENGGAPFKGQEDFKTEEGFDDEETYYEYWSKIADAHEMEFLRQYTPRVFASQEFKQQVQDFGEGYWDLWNELSWGDDWWPHPIDEDENDDKDVFDNLIDRLMENKIYDISKMDDEQGMRLAGVADEEEEQPKPDLDALYVNGDFKTAPRYEFF